MGDFQAQAVIGCLVPSELLYRLTPERACVHPLPEGAGFCPVCGKPAYKPVQEPIYNADTNMLNGLHVVSDTDKQHFIIGPLVAKAWADEIPGYEPLEGRMGRLEQQTRVVLEPLGLWDANTFGLYAVPYVSY